MRSSNLLEGVNEEIKRRMHIVRSFLNEASCLRPVRAMTVEIHEECPT
jgi:transposase-like protein